jgi:stringent starvation protein B
MYTDALRAEESSSEPDLEGRSMSAPLPPKKEVALALLERSSVHVHLDPRAAGVVVPAWFKKQPQLVLQVGLNMPVPIPDLRLDDEGLSCTLSFNRTPFFCVVPWSCVYALVGDDGRGMVWPDNVPPEVANQARSREGDGAAPKRVGPRRVVGPASSSASPDGRSSSPSQRASLDGRPEDADPSKARKPKKQRRTDGVVSRDGDSTKARANLVAVPSAPAEKAPPTLPRRRPLPAEPEAPSPAPSPVTQSRSDGPTTPTVVQAERRPNGSPRPKRELPPYLRVVK